jgi:flagellar biogenesis protein FliO
MVRWLVFAVSFQALVSSAADLSTNSIVGNAAFSPMADAGVSLFRVTGALALVLGLFLGGVWVYRNWRRLARTRGAQPKLNVLEVRSLGGKHALYVIGYEQERLLLSASPTGVTLLTHLPEADAEAEDAAQSSSAGFSFPAALAAMLRGKPGAAALPGGSK